MSQSALLAADLSALIYGHAALLQLAVQHVGNDHFEAAHLARPASSEDVSCFQALSAPRRSHRGTELL